MPPNDTTPSPSAEAVKPAASTLQTMSNDFGEKLVDRHGHEWVLRGLTLGDYAEFERWILQDRGERGPTERNMFVLWLAARGTGHTREEVRAGKYAIGFRDFMEAFDLTLIDKAGKLADNLFVFSGFDFKAIRGGTGEPGGGGEAKPAGSL